MKAILAVGFSYASSAGDKIRTPLPGIVVDLYHVWREGRKSLPHRLLVITDLEEDQPPAVLSSVISEGIVEDGVLSFVEKGKRNGYLAPYRDKTSFLEEITATVTDATEVWFYYSGHANEGKLLLPATRREITPVRSDYRDEERIPFDYILHILLTRTKQTAQIFVVLDCCGGIDPPLPYVLRGESYRLAAGNRPFLLREVVCIASSSKDEQASATKHGSVFSSELFDHIYRRGSRYLPRILEAINKKCTHIYGQTACIHSSYPDSKIVWPWLLSSAPTTVEIDTDAELIYVHRPT